MYKIGSFEVTTGRLMGVDPCKSERDAVIIDDCLPGVWTALTDLIGEVTYRNTVLINNTQEVGEVNIHEHKISRNTMLMCIHQKHLKQYLWEEKEHKTIEYQETEKRWAKDYGTTISTNYTDWLKVGGYIDVDSGIAGLFDPVLYPNPAFDHDGNRVKESPQSTKWKEFYDRVGKLAHGDIDIIESIGGVTEFGCVSSSGYGDGGYKCYKVRHNRDQKIIAVKIVYIGDDREEDEDDEEELILASTSS